MIVNDVSSKGIHQLIESQGRIFLEKSIRRTLPAHAVHDVGSSAPGIHHPDDGTHVVLQVGIDGHGCIRMGCRPLQTGPQRLLMTDIVRQLQPGHTWMCFGKSPDKFPSAVARTVVHVENLPFVYLPVRKQFIHHRRKLTGRLGQHLFFIITRHHDYQFHCLTHF